MLKFYTEGHVRCIENDEVLKMFGTTEAPISMPTFHEARFPNDWMSPQYFSLDHPELAFMPKYLSQAAKGPLFSRFADKEMRIEVVRKTADPSQRRCIHKPSLGSSHATKGGEGERSGA